MKDYICSSFECIIALEQEFGIDTGVDIKDCSECIYSIEVDSDDFIKEMEEKTDAREN